MSNMATIQQVMIEAGELTPESVARGEGISEANSGDRLGSVFRAMLDENPSAFIRARGAIRKRLDELGGAGGCEGLFLLAGDLAMAEAVCKQGVTDQERSELRYLWMDLLAA